MEFINEVTLIGDELHVYCVCGVLCGVYICGVHICAKWCVGGVIMNSFMD